MSSPWQIRLASDLEISLSQPSAATGSSSERLITPETYFTVTTDLQGPIHTATRLHSGGEETSIAEAGCIQLNVTGLCGQQLLPASAVVSTYLEYVSQLVGATAAAA